MSLPTRNHHTRVVTTCGVTSIKANPGDARVPISAAKLSDDEMAELLESSGATSFFTLVRYNMPQLLRDYIMERDERRELQSEKGKRSESQVSLASSGQKEEETAEEIIFMLFGPRVWEHEGNSILKPKIFQY